MTQFATYLKYYYFLLQNWYHCKISENWHFAMPPLGAAAENYNIGAQLHFLLYTKTSKFFLKLYAIYWFWCAQTY